MRSSIARSRSARNSSTLSRAIQRCVFESLDDRRMFSTLTVTGTSGPDLITVDYSEGNLIYVVNGGFAQIPAAGVTQITINGLGGDDTLQVERNNGIPTTVNGGDNNDTINLSPVAKVLNNIWGGQVDVYGGAGIDVVNYRDDNNTAAGMYDVDSLEVRRGGAEVAYYGADVETLFLTTGGQSDTVNVTSTDDKTAIELNSAGGADAVNIGNAVNGLAVIQSDITIRNSPNFSAVTLNDTADEIGRNVTFSTESIDGSLFGTITGFETTYGATVRYKLVDVQNGVTYNAGSGNDGFDILKTATRTININGGFGNDLFRVGGQSLVGNVAPIDAPLNLDGGSGIDQLDFRDGGQNAINGFTVTPTKVSATLMPDVTYSNMSSLLVYTGNALAVGHHVNNTPAGTQVSFVDGPGNNNYYINESAPGSNVRISGTTFSDNAYINSDNSGSATLEFVGSGGSRIGTLYVYDGGRAIVGAEGEGGSLAGSRVLTARGFLADADNGVLDIRNNTFVHDYDVNGAGVLQAIANATTTAYNGGTWNGPGIRSHFANAGEYAVGYADSGDILGAGGGLINGVTVDGTSVVVRFTRYGDANLDRAVGIADFARLGTGFNNAGTLWSGGNFNYDASTNIADFSLLASNYNQGLPGDAARPGGPLFGAARIIDDALTELA